MVLNQVQTSQLDRKLCRFGLNVLGQPVNNDKIICAGVLDGSKDACHGDSGGPLVCLSNRKLGWEQQGIISVGIGCSNKRNPGLYTRVSSFINWIKSKAMVSTHRMSCMLMHPIPIPIPIVLLQPKTITIMQHNYISEKSGNNGKPKRDADPAN